MQREMMKKRALVFGLDPVSEGSTTTNHDTTLPEVLPSDMDESKLAKDACFPVQETYDTNGVKIVTYYRPPASDTAPIYICHHGAGSSAMTFWAIANNCMQNELEAGFFTFDMRGHGKSSDPKPVDYSLAALTRDFASLIANFHSRHKPKNPICLIGHSLGGAVATAYVSENPACARGLVVVDIVEETAVRSLLHAPHFLASRPQSFSSISEAVTWHLSTRMLRNGASAKVSVCDLLVPSQGRLLWRADFSAMKPFWSSWFVDLSEKFVSATSSVAKLLVLSSNDTLDKSLMIGQMQGKYQLVVFNNTINAGHFIQEDIPTQFVMSIVDFMRRNDAANFSGKESRIETLWGGSVN